MTLRSPLDSVTGAVVIRKVGGLGGGLGVEGNLNVGGSAAFSGDVSFKAPVNFLSPLESTDYMSGAVTVVGGVGIGKRLNVQGNVQFNSALGVTGATTIGGATTIAGVTTINNTLNVNGSSSFIASFKNSTNANGISIQVGAPTPANANNFVEFRNSSGTVVGRIEGETIAELHTTNSDWTEESRAYAVNQGLGITATVIAGLNLGSWYCIGSRCCRPFLRPFLSYINCRRWS